jgi:hypothetical protein
MFDRFIHDIYLSLNTLGSGQDQMHPFFNVLLMHAVSLGETMGRQRHQPLTRRRVAERTGGDTEREWLLACRHHQARTGCFIRTTQN